MTGVRIEDLIKQGEAFDGKVHNGRDWKYHVISWTMGTGQRLDIDEERKPHT